MNTAILLGRLTADVELKESRDTEYAQFSIAVDRARNNGVDFINCVAFNKLAEALSKNCKKGRQLLVTGRIQTSQNKGRTYYSVVSNQITFLARPRTQAEKDAQLINRKSQAGSGKKTVAQGGKPF